MGEADTIQSRIEQVTVFASGARVRRVATLKAPLPDRVRFIDLPVAVIDDTVRAEVAGGAVVTALRAGLTIPGGETSPEETADLRAARLRQDTAQSEVQRLELSIDRLVHSKVIADDPSDEPPATWSAVVSARRVLVTAHAERQLALRQQLALARQELTDAQRAFEIAAERDHRTSSARAARVHETRKHVELDLAGTATGDVTIHIEYQVAAARWAPSYVARLDGDAARFELRAVVAQASGEDWTGVALRLSTAEPDQFAQLPELHPQKIGRRQAEPAKRGFRAPPAGADVLYSDYDQQFPPRAMALTGSGSFDDSTYEGRPPPPPPAPPRDEDADEIAFGSPPSVNWDEGSSRAKEAYQGAPAPQSAPMPASIAMPMRSRKSGSVANAIAGAVAAPFALGAAAMRKSAPGGGGGMHDRQAAEPAAPTPRLDYGNLRMAAPTSSQRGKLAPAPRVADAEAGKRVSTALAKLSQLVLPPGHVADWVHTYDYAFASDGVVDVKSDGAWHSLALTSRAGTAKLHHVAVPREQADVFRVATITNPFEGPLLPGPIDIYDRGQFLVTSALDYTPPAGSVDVGLGVDPNVKIARNTEFHEETAGMLRGALKLFHAVTVEIENLSARAIEVEVRERIPVTREGDDDVKVTLGKVDPAWERWTPDADGPRDMRLRGGYRWRVEVAPRTKKLLRAGYDVTIAGKNELVGGNRRES